MRNIIFMRNKFHKNITDWADHLLVQARLHFQKTVGVTKISRDIYSTIKSRFGEANNT